MKLSNQALGAVMLALQKSLMEQTDIVPVLKGFDFEANKEEELVVSNPPIVHAGAFEGEPETDDDFDTNSTVGSD
jgi:hypothetical protein